MKSKFTLHLTFFIFISMNSFGQSAFDYEGVFTRFSCNQTWFEDDNPIEIVVLNDSILVIRDFHGIPDDFIQGDEKDTVLVKLDFENDSIVPFDEDYMVNYQVLGSNLFYSQGHGNIYEDSLKIEFLQLNPQGSQTICVKYKRGDYSSITELKDIEYSVYPNPASETVFINFSRRDVADSNLNLKIFNLQGIEIQNQRSQVKDGQYQLQVKNLLSGVYLIVCETSEGSILLTEKLIIE